MRFAKGKQCVCLYNRVIDIERSDRFQYIKLAAKLRHNASLCFRIAERIAAAIDLFAGLTPVAELPSRAHSLQLPKAS